MISYKIFAVIKSIMDKLLKTKITDSLTFCTRLFGNLIHLGRCKVTKNPRGHPSISVTVSRFPFTKKKKKRKLAN